MTLDVTPEGLWKEIEYAEQHVKRRLASFDHLLKGYRSPFYESDAGEDVAEQNYNPENHAYEFVTFIVPQLAYSNPRIQLKSRAKGFEDEIAMLRHLGNQWIVDTNFGEFLQYPAHDCLFNWAVVHIYPDDHPSINIHPDDNSPPRPAKTVKVERISQHNWGCDPAAKTKREARYEFHRWTADKADLLKLAEDDDTWLADVIKGLPEGEATSFHGDENVPDRKELECRSIWVPEITLEEAAGDDSFHGTIYTMVSYAGSEGGHQGEFIRKPIPYYGPVTGPYEICDIHYVSDEVFGLAPLVATEGQNRDLNRHARSSSDSAARYKRLILCADTDPDFVSQVKSGEHDLVLPVHALTKDMVMSQEIGGITDQNLAYLNVAKERLDRVSGLHQAQRGNISSGGTATEAALADEASDVRVDYIKLQFARFVSRVLSDVLWYFYDHEDMRHVLPPEVGDELGLDVQAGQQVMYKGGKTPQSIPFEALSIELEPMSMGRMSQGIAQKRIVDAFNILVQIAQAKPLAPDMPWDDIIRAVGEAWNMPGLASKITGESAGPPMQQGMAPGMAQGVPQGEPEPQTSLGKVQSTVSRPGYATGRATTV